VRLAYPQAYISVLVRPYTRQVVEGNPYIDEVIVYDKREREKNLFRFFSFIKDIRRRKFDLALVLHPTNRDHLIVFFSGIPKRVGYERKCSFLLTDAMKFDKNSGLKHESEYALDAVRFLGISPGVKEFHVPESVSADRWVDDLFKAQGINPRDRIIVINPGASCPSKIWPAERYAAVADFLAGRGYRIAVIAGPDALDSATGRSVIAHMKMKPIDCIGNVPIPETVSLFRRAALVISADTGPMHIASAVGAPLIAIFGRNQAGISPLRWGPVNPNSIVLHRSVGCEKCLAHDCKKGFACLLAVTTSDVISAAEKLLKGFV